MLKDVDYDKLADKITEKLKNGSGDPTPLCSVGLTRETADILNELAPTLMEFSMYWKKSVRAVKWLLFTAFLLGVGFCLFVGIWHQFKGILKSSVLGGN